MKGFRIIEKTLSDVEDYKEMKARFASMGFELPKSLIRAKWEVVVLADGNPVNEHR